MKEFLKVLRRFTIQKYLVLSIVFNVLSSAHNEHLLLHGNHSYSEDPFKVGMGMYHWYGVMEA